MPPTDREERLQALADENARWADEELQLIETIRAHKRRLERLPDIVRHLNEEIRRLDEEREHATAEMNRTGVEHDMLEAKGKADAEFRAWANDMDDDYSDHLLAVTPPVGW